jgi:chemotaxis response regulator CheB
MALRASGDFIDWLNSQSTTSVELVPKDKMLETDKVYIYPPENDWEINTA